MFFLHPVQHENKEVVQSSLSQDEDFIQCGEIPVKDNETIQPDLPQDEPSVIILQDLVLPFKLNVNANEKTQNSEEKTINASVGTRQFEEKAAILNEPSEDENKCCDAKEAPNLIQMEGNKTNENVPVSPDEIEKSKKSKSILTEKTNSDLYENVASSSSASSSNGSLFEKHLVYPLPLEKSKKPRGEKIPSAISSKAWREHLNFKER